MSIGRATKVRADREKVRADLGDEREKVKDEQVEDEREKVESQGQSSFTNKPKLPNERTEEEVTRMRNLPDCRRLKKEGKEDKKEEEVTWSRGGVESMIIGSRYFIVGVAVWDYR
ncbi:hypothetical protein LguiA_005475 [Lonicera macranthoides]